MPGFRSFFISCLICCPYLLFSQVFPAGTLSLGGQLSLFASTPEKNDIDAGLHFLPAVEFFPLNNFGAGVQLYLDYSKVTTPSQVTITTQRSVVPYLRAQLGAIGLHAGSEIDLNYKYVPNVYGALTYAIFAAPRAVIEPVVSYYHYFGINRTLDHKLLTGINFKWLIIKPGGSK